MYTKSIDRIIRDALCIFLLLGMAQGKALGADLPQPGFGYPGRLEPCASTPAMQEGLVKFGMTRPVKPSAAFWSENVLSLLSGEECEVFHGALPQELICLQPVVVSRQDKPFIE